MKLRSPFRNNLATTLGILLFLTLFLIGGSQCAKAEDVEPVLEAEIGYTMIRGPALGIGLSVVWPEAGPRDAYFQCGLFLISEYELGGKTQPNQAIANCLMVTHIGKFDFGIGPAYLQNTDAINGSHFNFALMARWRVTDRLTLSWRHWSNAGTTDVNKGRDIVMLGWRF